MYLLKPTELFLEYRVSLNICKKREEFGGSPDGMQNAGKQSVINMKQINEGNGGMP